MRKSGGQPGHEGKTREMASGERVDERFAHAPRSCSGCGHAFSGAEAPVGDPVVYQQWELPPVRALVFEHSRLRLRCAGCGKAQLAALPDAALSGCGPRLEAHIAMLAGVYRLSRRQVADIVSQMFGVAISVGAVDAAIMRMSAVLADPWEGLREAVRAAEAVHADETGWRLRGAQQWLWVGASALAACYRIDPTRSQKAAKALLGEDFGGFVISDRYAGYHWLDVLQQQLCWAHVIRQMVAVSQRSGPPGKLGAKLLKAAREVFAIHRAYLEGEHDLTWLATELQPLRERICALLQQGARGRDQKTATSPPDCLRSTRRWTFCEVPGIDPTNNAAERALRHAVIMRKIQGGSQSEHGNRWTERILSINETCRLQTRSVLAYLIDAADAAHHGQHPPSLLPAGP